MTTSSLTERLHLRQFAMYVLVGGGAAAVNFGAGALVRLIVSGTGVYGASVVFGYVAGTVVAFFLHRRYTFSVADEAAGPQAARFAVVAAVGLVLCLIFSEAVLWVWGLAGSPLVSRHLAEDLDHVATIGMNTVYGFLANKFFALRRRDTGLDGGAPQNPGPAGP
jgi:putative flippase GtrA